MYTVEGATNGFGDHDELYWNAIGDTWAVSIDDVTVNVEAPGAITDSLCFQGPERSTLPCDGQKVRGSAATFRQQHLDPYSGVTIVLAFPKGVLNEPAPILEERWSLSSAFRLTPVTGGVSGALLLLIVGGAAVTLWRTGRDRRYRGSPIDQVMGNPTGEDEAVPIFDADTEAPVEFAPPGDMRPGQMGTLVDEQANTLDVSATIVDLAVRGFLMVQEIPKEGWFGKPDWTLIKLEESEAGLLTYERRLLNALFRDGTEVTISESAEHVRGSVGRRRGIAVRRRREPWLVPLAPRQGPFHMAGAWGRGADPGSGADVRPGALDPLGAARHPAARRRTAAADLRRSGCRRGPRAAPPCFGGSGGSAA